MSIEWTGLGPELLLRLDRTLPEPLGSQLERELREAIRSGRLGTGERLPSSRALAGELGVSRGLVLDCYQQLQAEGYLTTRIGSATRVAAGAYLQPAPPVQAAPPSRLAVDFRPGLPDLSSFPGATGCGRCARPLARRPRICSVTATRAAARRCARCWPPTCAGSAAPPPTPSGW